MKTKNCCTECDFAEIKRRLQEIIQKSHRNRLDSNSAGSSELQADDFPHARELHLNIAREIRERISKREKEIEEHKVWIEQHSPGFFRRVSFVQKHIVTWDLDLPAIRFPLNAKSFVRKACTRLTLDERKKSISKRKTLMHEWYCFFFGTSHLESPSLIED